MNDAFWDLSDDSQTVLVPLTSIVIVRGRCINPPLPAQVKELLSLHWA